jgi:hypothetical protein
MQPNQKIEVVEYLRYLRAEGYTHFHHGDCIGADAQAASYAKQLGFTLVCHPGHPRDKNNTMYRAFTTFNDVMHEVKPFAVRDRDIVDAVDTMVATPVGLEEIRSGTWTTVRYAKRQEKPVRIIYPERVA